MTDSIYEEPNLTAVGTKVWRDREGTLLEGQLPKCVAGMMKIALKQRAERKKREEEELAQEKKIEEVTQELREIEAEEKKIRTLKKEAVLWLRAERIENLVSVALVRFLLCGLSHRSEVFPENGFSGLSSRQIESTR